MTRELPEVNHLARALMMGSWSRRLGAMPPLLAGCRATDRGRGARDHFNHLVSALLIKVSSKFCGNNWKRRISLLKTPRYLSGIFPTKSRLSSCQALVDAISKYCENYREISLTPSTVTGSRSRAASGEVLCCCWLIIGSQYRHIKFSRYQVHFSVIVLGLLTC